MAKEYFVEFKHVDPIKGHQTESAIFPNPINGEDGLTDAVENQGYTNVEITNYRVATPEDY